MNNKKKQYLTNQIFFCLVLFTLVCYTPGCNTDSGIKIFSNETPSLQNDMGIVPFPSDWSESSKKDAYNLARYCGTYISIALELGWINNDNITNYQDDISYANERSLNVIISMDVLIDSRTGIRNLPAGWESKDFSDIILRDAFIDEAYAIASAFKPDYLFLALEINGYAPEKYSDFLNFTTMYGEAYDRIKSDYPKIKIGVTFNYEQMLAETQWAVLSDFNNKLDCYGFTTYPQILYPDMDNIPDNYYSSVLNSLGSIPIIMTEIGWQGNQDSSDENRQQKFITKYFKLTETCNITINVWCLLHDWTGGGFFQSMGLIDTNGRKKPAWNKWYEYSHK